MDRKSYHLTLPQKRISAGCLFFDEDQKLLIVNPTYKKTWEIPGGVVEKNESPRDAVIREVKEELGIECSPKRLLCVDYSSESGTRTESLQFIFLGPQLTSKMIRSIRLPAEELSEYRLLDPNEAVKFLNKKLRRRVSLCLQLIDSSETLYLDEQQLVGPFVYR